LTATAVILLAIFAAAQTRDTGKDEDAIKKVIDGLSGHGWRVLPHTGARLNGLLLSFGPPIAPYPKVGVTTLVPKPR
jgi:hypothetical protein